MTDFETTPSIPSRNSKQKDSTKVKASKYKGVYKGKTAKSWASQIAVDKKKYCLGTFETEEEAAAAYNAAVRHFKLRDRKPNEGVPEDDTALENFLRRREKVKPARYRGAYKRSAKSWVAHIAVKGKSRSLGTFRTEEEAAAAYNAAARHFKFPVRKLNAGVSEDYTAIESFLRRGEKVKTTRYRGVHKNSQSKSWVAQITVQGKRYCLGCFATAEEAAAAYNAAARHFDLPKSRLNSGVAEDNATIDKLIKKLPDISA